MPEIPKRLRKRLGLPYQGSKRDIAFSVVCAIYQRHPNAEYFYDLFGGGGAITAMAVQFGYKVIYNEYNTAVYNLFKRCIEKEPIPREWYDWVPREKFFDCKGKTDPYSAMVQCCYGFGNGGRTYLYGTDIEENKRLLSEIIVHQDAEALKKINAVLNINLTMPNAGTITGRRHQIRQQIIRLNNLERLTQLEHLQRLEHLHNLSYESVPIDTPKDKTVVYLDPPYRNTTGYTAGDFDNSKLDEWFKACPYPCYMSEYDAPFECVLSLRKPSLMNNTAVKRTFKTERLYWNGKR